MARLNTEKQEEEEPKRAAFAIKQLQKLGIVEFEIDDRSLKFTYKNVTVKIYPYSGWFTGKGIQDGRGISELIFKLKKL